MSAAAQGRGEHITECRAVGVVPNANATPLANALRGMCTKYNKMNVYEATLTIPGKNTNMRVQRRVRPSNNTNPVHEKLADRWCVLWESAPNLGPTYRDLPATVREVCESQCAGSSAPAFWQSLGAKFQYNNKEAAARKLSLGAKFQYDMVKEGNEYICHHKGFEMRVQLMRILAPTVPGNPDSATKNVSANFLLDVTTRVGEGQHVEGARAVGSFGQSLQPLVSLQRAERPIAG
ncbi:hypothetical protein FOA52_010401 [Chlamydomonas sp. UWO 241]|nr:hypothetical protein FOA52_010401 [Chlamydomonas sp. UWO 241]